MKAEKKVELQNKIIKDLKEENEKLKHELVEQSKTLNEEYKAHTLYVQEVRERMELCDRTIEEYKDLIKEVNELRKEYLLANKEILHIKSEIEKNAKKAIKDFNKRMK